jgi:crossover junction endodeoxyribonuclease RusA
VIEFFVPGLPQPQGSKSSFAIRNKSGAMVGVNTTESNKKTRPWRADVKAYAQEAMGGTSLLLGPVCVYYDFVIYRPTSLPKRTPVPTPLDLAVKKPDWEKLARAVGDALSGTVYVDDNQVVGGHVTKRVAELGESPGVHVRVLAA